MTTMSDKSSNTISTCKSYKTSFMEIFLSPEKFVDQIFLYFSVDLQNVLRTN